MRFDDPCVKTSYGNEKKRRDFHNVMAHKISSKLFTILAVIILNGNAQASILGIL